MLIIYIFLGIYILAMLFVLFYSILQGHLLYHFLKQRKKLSPLALASGKDLPKVTVQLPVYNEKYVIERLIEAAAALRYPREKLEVQILDDSTDETTSLIKNKISAFPDTDFVHIHRKDRTGFKAGALREGLQTSKGDLIAIFDADFVPDPDFLLKTVPFFEDKKVGMVQSRWSHLNEGHSVLTRLQAFALDAHFMVEQIGRNAQDVFINFNGTGGIWRKTCILDAGNWEDDTLTEDLDLSYRAQRKGWKFIYRPDIESPAELPPVMSAIKSQQFRWTKGGAACAKKHLVHVWKGDFGWHKKLHATAHLLNAAVFIAILLVSISSIPLWYAFSAGALPLGLFQMAAVFLLGFVVIALVYLFANLSLAGYSWRVVLRFLWELPLFLSVSMGLALHNGLAVWEGLTGKKSPFVRTPKYNLTSSRSWKENIYNQIKIPATTYMEGGLALLFSLMVLLSIVSGTYEMLMFHLMLAVGYSIIAWTSFKSYAIKSD